MRTIQNNQFHSRIELYEDGRLAGFIQYRMQDRQIWLLHTLISTQCKDLSLVDDLLGRALQDLQRRRIEVLPFCPAVRHYMAGQLKLAHGLCAFRATKARPYTKLLCRYMSECSLVFSGPDTVLLPIPNGHTTEFWWAGQHDNTVSVSCPPVIQGRAPAR